MPITFGDFNNEILKLNCNKSPLGLNSDIESYKTANSEVPSEMSLEKMEEYHDVTLHYLQSAVSTNSSTDTDQTTTSKIKTSPSLQVNTPNSRPIHLISSGNIAKSTLFERFKNIQQLHKRFHTKSHTDNMGEIPGTCSEIIENNLTIQPKLMN